MQSGGTIRFETASDVHTESHERSKSSFTWQSSSGEGFTRETLRQSKLVAQGELIIQAADALHIDLGRRSTTVASPAPSMPWEATSALSACANEALVEHMAELVNDNPRLLEAASQVVGVIARQGWLRRHGGLIKKLLKGDLKARIVRLFAQQIALIMQTPTKSSFQTRLILVSRGNSIISCQTKLFMKHSRLMRASQHEWKVYILGL